MSRALLLSILLTLTLALAGCSGSDDGDDHCDDGHEDEHCPAPTTSDTPGPTTSRPATTTPGPTPPAPTTASIDTFEADPTGGEAPVNVTFSIDGTSDDPEATWTLEFGDGMDMDGNVAELPTAVTHTYSIGGSFNSSLTIHHGVQETRSDNVTIIVTVPSGGGGGGEPAEAPTLEFSYAESLGCAGDLLRIAGGDCISFTGGPDASGIDGFWQPLDERYWGMSLTSTIDPDTPGDSDCDFTDADLNILGEGNNGGGPCEGVVPAGTAWMFIYPYVNPALGMTVTFSG